MITSSELLTITQAIQIQVNLHFLPAWNLKSATVKFFADEKDIPGYAWVIYVIDSQASVPGALGYHQEESSGKIDGYIMCEPILSNGGDVLKFDANNPGKYTVSGTLSHEICECIIDIYTNFWCDNGTTSWCKEVADPVEQVGYGVMVDGVEVAVSDFVFPSFFNPDATLIKNAPFNYLNTLTAPFTMLSGGYSIQRTGSPGTETQVFGEEMPQWRRDTKRFKFNRKFPKNQETIITNRPGQHIAKKSFWQKLIGK
jgi:hypothetical protein